MPATLIIEEAIETIEALGFYVSVDLENRGEGLKHDWTLYDNPDLPSLVKIVDGCCDTIVVTTGTLSACGVRDLIPQALVDYSNLAKFGEGSYRREDGKWIKPANWQAPDLKGEIERQLKL